MDITTLVYQLKLANESSLESLPQDPGVRKELAALLSNLRQRLENPADTIMRFLFQPHQNAVIRIAIDLNLFSLIGEGKKNSRSAAELERLTGADKVLIVRIMRVLTSVGIVSEIDEQRYAATPVSEAWTIPPLRDGTKHLFDEAFYSLAHAPAFLKQTNYKNLTDSNDGLFQFAFNTPHSIFDYLNGRPDRLAAFNTLMQRPRDGETPGFEHFPFEEAVCKGLKDQEEAVLIVDVGGGRGHNLEALKKAFPNQHGRLILQDQPQTIDEIGRQLPGIESMRYDFFAPQPIKGARSYFFRHIFHDWPDEKCRMILRNTVDAMEKHYSRILISDWVLLDRGSPWLPACMDMNMLALCSGMERTERQWRELLASVGLKIVNIWGMGRESESLIEVVLSDSS